MSKLDAIDVFKAGLIEGCKAKHWSQILTTPKEKDAWRFCVDFRHLNLGTKSVGGLS